MTNQVIFDTTVGGDGSTVTDDGNPSTGLAEGGHETRLVPAFANIVAIGQWVKNRALDVAGYVTTALSYKNAAGASADIAIASATAAHNSEVAGADSATLASDWASKTSGPVSGGEYSAKHWAQQAQATVSNQLILRGAWDASGGTYPTPLGVGDLYRVSVAGTVGGVLYGVGDDIRYNGTGWDKTDNQQSATPDLYAFIAAQG